MFDKLFKRGGADKAKAPLDFALLGQGQLKCAFCDKTLKLADCKPLSLEKCPDCGSANFIPYKVKNFWLCEPLGGGGMGSVYKAYDDARPDVAYAVKILARNARNNQHLIRALVNEASVGKEFGAHPHLIPVADYGNCGDEYFMAMQFVEGRRLDQIIEGHEAVPQKFVLLWSLQILSAEQRIFDKGYLFRDLKPQNIIIDASGNARLFDYGLCIKAVNATYSDSDTVEGSPIYMPPERIVGMPENMSSEIYSLGMVMFHALTGKTYYSATDAYNIAKKHVASIRMANVSSRMPKHVHPHIPAIIDKMIQRTPSDRYQTFKEVAIDIRNVYNKL